MEESNSSGPAGPARAETWRLAQLLGVPVGTARRRRVRTVLDPGRRPREYAVFPDRGERFTLTHQSPNGVTK